jgi:hypothetical protein
VLYLIGGQVDLVIATMTGAAVHHKSGKPLD